MSNINYFKEQYDQLQQADNSNGLAAVRKDAMKTFNLLGIPTTRNEEWKYTRISSLFNKEYTFAVNEAAITAADIDAIRLPDHQHANELVFINGIFNAGFSVVRSAGLTVLPLSEAANNEYKTIVDKYYGHSSDYLKDGINALNTALMQDGVFAAVKRNSVIEHPVYIYNITDARTNPVLSQPRSLIYIGENAQVQIAETYKTLGAIDSITNQVMEVVVEQDANVSLYKIQNDASHASQVNTTHIRQVGKSYVHTVVISLEGAIVRNNLNIIMEAQASEAHLYGLYFPHGNTHIDNHTTVDNVMPDCQSTELYKGILDGASTGVFNGKIYVRKDAQKTNAFQSNKNVLLSDGASVNTKPQLEIFADDVKCSHGCTIGSIDGEGLFYLQSRGISKKAAMSLLLQSFAMDILDKIKLAPVRAYVDKLIEERLTIEAL